MEQEYLATVGSGSPSPAGGTRRFWRLHLPSTIANFGLAGLVGLFVATGHDRAGTRLRISRKSFRHLDNTLGKYYSGTRYE